MDEDFDLNYIRNQISEKLRMDFKDEIMESEKFFNYDKTGRHVILDAELV